MENRIDDRRLVLPGERPRPRYHLVEHDSQRPDVAPAVDFFPRRLLRRHVRRGPERRVGLREPGVPAQFRQAEIQYLGHAVVCHHDVGRLDVPVDDPLLVGFVQAFSDLDCERENVIDGERPLLDPVLESPALDKFHRDEGSAVVFIDLVDRADVGMVEGGRRPGFVYEAGLGVFIAREIGVEELEGDGPFELRVLGLVDHAHPALAELGEDLVVGNGLADHPGPPERSVRRIEKASTADGRLHHPRLYQERSDVQRK